MKRYGFFWVTLAFFIVSFVGQWALGWFAYVDEQQAHGQEAEFGEYALMLGRDTLENWQSEFLQLIWQVAGLKLLLFQGSPQSKEGDERKEEKIDRIIELLEPQTARETIARLDAKFPGR
jgi:hypothetical protein